MSHVEFDTQASLIADQIPSLPEGDRIAAACRGSGNPAALSWLAEGLRLDESTTVIDLGSGLGGPSAWLHERFRCQCINLEMSAAASSAAAQIFKTPTVCGSAERTPFRTDSSDVALLLGVLSVVTHPEQVLKEARRIAGGLGVLDYCSTSSTAALVGGSKFVSATTLREQIEAAGWHVVQMVAVTVPAPATWTDACISIDVEPEATETEVVDAIDDGRIVPFMLHATRSPVLCDRSAWQRHTTRQ